MIPTSEAIYLISKLDRFKVTGSKIQIVALVILEAGQLTAAMILARLQELGSTISGRQVTSAIQMLLRKQFIMGVEVEGDTRGQHEQRHFPYYKVIVDWQ